jgi:hypothetical protein
MLNSIKPLAINLIRQFAGTMETAEKRLLVILNKPIGIKRMS